MESIKKPEKLFQSLAMDDQLRCLTKIYRFKVKQSDKPPASKVKKPITISI